MIPLRDNISRRRFAVVNAMLIAANVIVFAYEVRIGPRAGLLLEGYGLVPAHLEKVIAPAPALWALGTLVTSLFLHGGLLHVAGNMLYLYIFGPAVEERMGHARYFWFYIGSGVAAGLSTVWMAPQSVVPVIGASGAIAGVLGAYFIFYPGSRILTLLPVFIFVQFVEVPAILYLLIWFAAQLYGGIEAQAQGGMASGVAWWAHIGGFLFGLAVGPIVAPWRARRRLPA